MHTLIAGITESGKTTLALQMAAAQRKGGFPVIVFTAAGDDLVYWRRVADFATDSRDEFLKVYNSPRTRGCMVYIDEGIQTMKRFDLEMQTPLTKGRHFGVGEEPGGGHSVHVLCTGANDLAPVVRRNCTRAIVFKQDPDSADLLARRYVQPGLRAAVNLGKGDYLVATGFGPLRAGKVEFKRP